MAVRKGTFEVGQVRSHDGGMFLNLDADYGWLAAFGHAHKGIGCAAALVAYQDTGNIALVAFVVEDGIPERFKDWTVLWHSHQKEE